MKEADFHPLVSQIAEHLDDGFRSPLSAGRYKHSFEIRGGDVQAGTRFQDPLSNDPLEVLSINNQFDLTSGRLGDWECGQVFNPGT